MKDFMRLKTKLKNKDAGRKKEYCGILKIILFIIPLVIILVKPLTTSAALISTENNDREFNTQKIHKTSSVLISKEEAKSPDLNFVIRAKSDQTRSVLVSYEDQGFTGTFIVRQETASTAKTLGSQANPLDMRILNIISDENINSIEDYAQWLEKNFEYKSDEGPDIWAAPEETLTRKYGDCEDFAFLNEAVLRVFGYRPQVLAMGGGIKTVNHAICAFEKDGYYLWFDNNKLKKTLVSSVEEFGAQVVTRHGYAYMFKIKNEGGKQTILADDILR